MAKGALPGLHLLLGGVGVWAQVELDGSCLLSGKSGRRDKRNYWSALALVGGGANASCYTGALGGNLAVTVSANICIAVVVDRSDVRAGGSAVGSAGGANASCYTGALGGSIAALVSANICIAVVVDRNDVRVVFLPVYPGTTG